jgi:hypothetical protein
MRVDLSEAPSIEARVKQLDVSLFDAIGSQTSPDDRRSMLAIHAAVSARLGPFTYLEIGSHLGGSIQPFLLDHRCTHIVSIDKRPKVQADARGTSYEYPGNSTERMLQNLRKIAKDGVAKITTLDMDSSELRVSMLPSKMDLCFIDGEHTNSAAERDFAFCESALAASGVIYFHDSEIVFQALDNILKCLRAAGRPFHAYNLPTSIFVIDLGMNIHEDDSITKFLSKNHLGYIAGLQSMAHYRHFYNHWLARLLRKAYPTLRKPRVASSPR